MKVPTGKQEKRLRKLLSSPQLSALFPSGPQGSSASACGPTAAPKPLKLSTKVHRDFTKAVHASRSPSPGRRSPSSKKRAGAILAASPPKFVASKKMRSAKSTLDGPVIYTRQNVQSLKSPAAVLARQARGGEESQQIRYGKKRGGDGSRGVEEQLRIRRKFVGRKKGLRPAEMVVALGSGMDVPGLSQLAHEEQSGQPYLHGTSREYAEGASREISHFASASLSRDEADSAWRAPVQPAAHL